MTEPRFDYRALRPPTEIRKVEKQSAKRHFGVHGYFTKQAYGVVQKYIANFTNPGDVVLDPFGGSGVTLVEALMLGRKATHIDLNPLSVFIAENLIAPVRIHDINGAFTQVALEFQKRRPTTED